MSERISPLCRVVFLLSLTCLAALAACSAPGPDGLTVPTLRQDKEIANKSDAVVRIAIPRRKERRRGADYVSPATQSIAIVVASSAGKPKTFNVDLTPATNPNCQPVKVVCSVTLLLAPGKYTASFTTYDGLLDHRGRPTGNRLSANQEVPFSMVEGKATVVPVTLGGIPAAVAFIPATSSTLTGNSVSGFSLSRCNASAQTVNVFGVDADGNYILGSGSPTISLKSSSETLKVASPRPAAPNSFTVTPPAPPTYVFPGTSIFLTAQATPTSSSGAPLQSLLTKITFSSDICGVFTEFPIPTASSAPRGITVGPDGALWFTERRSSKIGRIPTSATISNPQITEFPTPTANAGPDQIAAASDGNLWFTECFKGQIGRIPISGTGTLEFPTSASNSAPHGIVQGADGAMWFTECVGNNIGRIPTSGALVVQEFPVPTAGAGPYGITAADGGLWFTESHGNNAGLISSLGGPIRELPIPTPSSLARGITADQSGTVWFTECNGGSVGRIPESFASITEYSLGGGDPLGITVGSDGGLWYAQASLNQISRISPVDGSVVSYTVPTALGTPLYIVEGPDGALWFTEFRGNKIGRLQ